MRNDTLHKFDHNQLFEQRSRWSKIISIVFKEFAYSTNKTNGFKYLTFVDNMNWTAK